MKTIPVLFGKNVIEALRFVNFLAESGQLSNMELITSNPGPGEKLGWLVRMYPTPPKPEPAPTPTLAEVNRNTIQETLNLLNPNLQPSAPTPPDMPRIARQPVAPPLMDRRTPPVGPPLDPLTGRDWSTPTN